MVCVMVNEHPVLYVTFIPNYIEATTNLVERVVNIPQQGTSPGGSFLFKMKTFFYKSLGETFAVDAALVKDVKEFWGEQSGMATNWRKM